jgi:hypothetical protein
MVIATGILPRAIRAVYDPLERASADQGFALAFLTA